MAWFRPRRERAAPLGVPPTPPSETDRRALGALFFELVGLPLSAFDGERLSHAHFLFGDPHREVRGRIEVGKGWRLSPWCGWRLVDGDGEILSALAGLRGEVSERIEAVRELVRRERLVVTDVGVRADASVRLGLSEDRALFLLPWDRNYTYVHNLSQSSRWYLQTPDGDPRGDLFFGTDGLQWSPKPDERETCRHCRAA